MPNRGGDEVSTLPETEVFRGTRLERCLTSVPRCDRIRLHEEKDIVGSDPEEEATASHLAAPGCAGRRRDFYEWLLARFLRCVSRLEYPDREADSNGESCPFLFLCRAGLFSTSVPVQGL